MTTNAEKYRIWSADWDSNYCVLGYLLGFPDDYKLMKGHAVSQEWPADVRMAMDPDFKKQIKLADNLTNPVHLVLASKALQDFFKGKEIPDVEYLPLTILNHKKKVASSEYCIVNPVGTQACIDTKKSVGLTWNQINPDDILSVKQLVVDESKIDKRAVLFHAKHLKGTVFIRSDLAEAIEAAGFTNIVFQSIPNFRK